MNTLDGTVKAANTRDWRGPRPTPPCVVRRPFPALLALDVTAGHGILWLVCKQGREVHSRIGVLAFCPK